MTSKNYKSSETAKESVYQLTPKTYVTIGAVGYAVQILFFAASGLSFALSGASFFQAAQNTGNLSAVSASFAQTQRVQSIAIYVLLFSSLIAISLAWFFLGKKDHSGLLTATGVIGIVGAIIGIASTTTSFRFSPSPAGIGNPLGGISPLSFLGLVLFGLAAGLLFLTFVIIELVSLFSASKIYQSRRFRLAGISRIAAIIVTVVALVGIMAAFILSIPPSYIQKAGLGVPQQIPSQVIQSVAGSLVIWVGAIAMAWAISSTVLVLAFLELRKRLLTIA